MDTAAELGRNPVSKHQIQPEYGDEQADAGQDSAEPVSRDQISGTNADREIIIFPVQLIHTLVICVTIHTVVSIGLEL